MLINYRIPYQLSKKYKTVCILERPTPVAILSRHCGYESRTRLVPRTGIRAPTQTPTLIGEDDADPCALTSPGDSAIAAVASVGLAVGSSTVTNCVTSLLSILSSSSSSENEKCTKSNALEENPRVGAEDGDAEVSVA